ncbi:hypothetical protein GUJ93_ZPchr0010g9049 [Zizania palustris]|uniref:Uncharacterized protein n=1 Tax=Zizania palustris TaxID=103762 RepID=A0A8J5WB48_ZIZPA|nr:hypothetical protein GUJ93_ZPchr0010g9049 [Zizania palustris]
MPRSGIHNVDKAGGSEMGKGPELEGKTVMDEEMAEKLQIEEIAQFESEKGGNTVMVASVAEEGNHSGGVPGDQVDTDDVTQVYQNSGEEGGRIHITDSEEYIDSQESVDFATRVGIIIADKDKEPDDEERRRCERLKIKEDKSVMDLAISRKEVKNAFVDKGNNIPSLLMMIIFPYIKWLVFLGFSWVVLLTRWTKI